MHGISVLMKPSSGMCNMRCDYCFYCDETQNRMQTNYGFMTERTLKNVIRKTMLQADKVISYAFQGGEPTLCGIEFFQKCIELEKKYNKNRIIVHNALQTNGMLIDEKWCQFLKDNHFLVGISLDGTQEVHDAYRHDQVGNPTFERICHSIDLLEKYEVDYNILTVVNRRVASQIGEIYKFYKRKKFQYQQYIVCLEPLQEQHGQREYAISPKQYGKFLIELFQLWYRDWKNGTQPYIRQFDNYLGIIMGYQPEACDQRGTCGIQTVVEADGSVYPCDFYMLDEYRLGNFNFNRLDDINAKRIELKFIERSLRLEKKCIECAYYSLCRGGCQRNRDLLEATGEYKNYYCESYRMFFKSCKDQMMDMALSMTR
ncbi:anaerobic sulfatase maturase [Faecalicatena contorta]|uniref:anaerobic sulfatase maturase n=2 Tax=Clostridia TaxID=186801 RepID=UPI00067F1C0B|nr:MULTISPECIES: anaerobic sulfatase maturase [Clostridia]